MSTLLPAVNYTTVFLTGGAVVLSALWYLCPRRPVGAPPGPSRALPLLGHLTRLSGDPRVLFSRWRRQYGDLFSLYMGSRLTVVLNGYDVIREAFVKMADVFSDRPHYFFTDVIAEGKGIVFTSGAVWKENRKNALEILRQLGMGRNFLADKIQEEITHYIRAIGDHQGAPFDPRHLTTVSISNNICGIMFGKRFEYDDPIFTQYLSRMDENLANLTSTAALNFLPFLNKLPGDLFNAKKSLANVKFIEDSLLRPIVEQHLEVSDEDPQPDFIHCYIRQMRRHQANGEESSLSESDLVKTLGDLFTAGTETTSTTIAWAFLLFLHYPHVQEKCFQEVSDVIGTDRPPSMQDKPKMTYMEATTMEILRFTAIAPFAVQHCVSCDVTFRGYVIPKDTMIIPNLDSALKDKDAWGDPEKFRPERFISPDGSIVKPDEFVVFSLGRRVCLGESLARMELFLYLTTLLQRFLFLPLAQEPLPSLQGILGATDAPRPYRMRAVPRE